MFTMFVNSRLQIQVQFWKTLYVGTLQGIGLKEMSWMNVDKRKVYLILLKVSLCLWTWIEYSKCQSMVQCHPWLSTYDFSGVNNLVLSVWRKYIHVCFKRPTWGRLHKIVGAGSWSQPGFKPGKFQTQVECVSAMLLYSMSRNRLWQRRNIFNEYLKSVDWTALAGVWSQLCFWWCISILW
jgi:hypothetical protein